MMEQRERLGGPGMFRAPMRPADHPLFPGG